MKSKDSRSLPRYPGGNEAGEAFSHYAADRSLTVVTETASGMYVGSSVCIRIDGRLFVATARHCIEPAVGYRLLPRGEIGHAGLQPIAASHPRSAPWPHDVAWLEIDPLSPGIGRLRALELSDLLVGQIHQPEQVFAVQGFPAEEVEDVASGALAPRSITLGTISLPPTDSRLVVEWPPSSAEDAGLQLVNPHGVSGGGVWRYPAFSDSLIWLPEASKLVGLAAAWLDSRCALYCEPIQNWLSLVATDHPGLKQAIATVSRFRTDA